MTLYESSRSEGRVGSWPGHRRIRASFWNCRARGAAALVVAAVLHAHAASAGTCISPWQLRTGTTLDDEIHAAVRDSDGNVYLGGFDDGLLNVENDWPVGGVSGFVEKRSNDGALLSPTTGSLRSFRLSVAISSHTEASIFATMALRNLGVANVIAKDEGNISNLKITNRSTDFFELLIDVEVRNARHLAGIINSLRAKDVVQAVERV